MGNLKVKDIEGDPLDIHKLFQEGNCDFPSYIGAETRRKRVSNLWIVVLTLGLFILASCIYTDIFNSTWNKVAVLGVFFLGPLVVLIIYYNFKSIPLTVLTGIAYIIITLLVLKVYSPQGIAKKMEDVTTKKWGEK